MTHRQLVKENPRWNAETIAVEILETLNVTVSAQTIRNILHDNGLKGCIPKKKPLVKNIYKKQHLEFANECLNKGEQFWTKVLWSDETKISLLDLMASSGYGGEKAKLSRKYCFVPTVKNCGGSLRIWGCMSAKEVRDLFFIEGRMDSNLCCWILEEQRLPSLTQVGRRAVFQQDNDP